MPLIKADISADIVALLKSNTETDPAKGQKNLLMAWRIL